MPCLSRGNRSPEGIRSGSPARFQRSRTQADRQCTRLRLPQEQSHQVSSHSFASSSNPQRGVPMTAVRLPTIPPPQGATPQAHFVYNEKAEEMPFMCMRC